MINERIEIESREAEPKHNIVMADFLRHGTSEYQEERISPKEKKALKNKHPRDLTPQGEQELRIAFEKIIQTINPETDIVVLWSSPSWRTQGSKAILIEMLEERGIEIAWDFTINSMRSFDQRDKKFMQDFWSKLAPTGKPAELVYARDPEFQKKNDKFESQPEVKKRAEKVFEFIGRLTEKATLRGKRLRIIGVSHFEFLNPIIEEVFGTKLEKGEGIVKGENVSFTFDYNLEAKDMKISANFRGENKEGINFDKENRQFIAESN